MAPNATYIHASNVNINDNNDLIDGKEGLLEPQLLPLPPIGQCQKRSLTVVKVRINRLRLCVPEKKVSYHLMSTHSMIIDSEKYQYKSTPLVG